jgi:Zn-dependent M28 family amino/carboxypeptidase
MSVRTSFSLAVVLFSMASLVVLSCKEEKRPETDPKPAQSAVTPISIPSFHADSAFLYVKKQVDFGPRVPNSAAHRRCAQWLSDELRRQGLVVIEQPFTARQYNGTTLQGINIIGQYNPDHPRRILLAAHWDSRFIADQDEKDKQKPILGADDGASGVGVLLEIARTLNNNPVDIGVDIVFFDAEDQGNDADDGLDHSQTWCLGAQHWAKNLHKPGYSPLFGILLDMVGAPSPRFAREGISRQAAPQILDRVWRQAANLGYAGAFVQEDGAAITDDHLFVIQLARIPMINIINRPGNTPSGFVPHWHTHNDNLSSIDKNTLGMVGNVVVHTIYNTYNQTF